MLVREVNYISKLPKYFLSFPKSYICLDTSISIKPLLYPGHGSDAIARERSNDLEAGLFLVSLVWVRLASGVGAVVRW